MHGNLRTYKWHLFKISMEVVKKKKTSVFVLLNKHIKKIRSSQNYH